VFTLARKVAHGQFGPGSMRLYGCSWPWPTMWYLSRGTPWRLVMSHTSLADCAMRLAFHAFCLAKPACSMPTVKLLPLTPSSDAS
jgi:hypothetical protein